MKTVRELIQALILNCDLDDKVEVEFKTLLKDGESFTFSHEKIRRVLHLGGDESIIECHDE